ncbi:MAG: hypothetical protein JWP57_3692 [Spirosoma sp.]|nr:hypothetical protein [Spirosoma sp.]
MLMAEKGPTDLNALVIEYLKIAYQGAGGRWLKVNSLGLNEFGR